MPTVSAFLLERLAGAGVGAVFGVPGDYILSLFKKIEDDPGIDLVGTTDEANAGFAADAYARVHGVGCVAATYNVGALKIVNPIAGAFAERSPVVVLVGSPGVRERTEGVLLHHTVGGFDTQREIFSKITCAHTVLDDPTTAAYEIDRVLAAMKTHKQPVYVEIPRDVADRAVSYDLDLGTPVQPVSDPYNLSEAVDEVAGWLETSESPVILAGVELARFGLGDLLVRYAERTNLPVFTEALSKSVVGERHPLFGGVYTGSSGPAAVRDAVEQSDCILMLGVLLTDMVLGSAKPKFDRRQTIRANVDGLKVRNHSYADVVFHEFCAALFRKTLTKKPPPAVHKRPARSPFKAAPGPLRTSRFFEQVNSMIGKDTVVITDVGDSLFGSLDLLVETPFSFISPAYYTSMGMAIPAALGVGVANPGARPLVLVGDGAFQMSFSEISTMVRWGMNPIIFVLNNGGYTTERFILDGKFNDIHDWDYHKVVDVFGGEGYLVKTEKDLELAVAAAVGNKNSPSVINVVVARDDVSPALARMTEGLAKKV